MLRINVIETVGSLLRRTARSLRDVRPKTTSSGNFPQIVPTIEAIATGVPSHTLKQSDAAKFVANLPSIQKNESRIEKIYRNTRIATRHMAVDMLTDEQAAFSREKGNIKARMDLYKQHATPLAERVVSDAISQMDSATIKDDIGMVVFVSSTGFVGPGIDAALISRLGLRRDVSRVTVNFMGCAAAMNGLRVGSDYVKAYPDRKALVVCLELSSLNAVYDDNLNDIIIHSIFGDGCAAVILGGSDANSANNIGKIAITQHFSCLMEGTEEGITLGVEDNGITCKLSKYLPDYIEAGVNPVIENFLDSQGLTKEDIELWAVHPGGTKIIQKSQVSLGLTDEQVEISWKMLNKYGNMLSVSILFVLEEMFKARELNKSAFNSPSLTGIGFSFSPGVGLEGILFQQL